MCMSSIFRSKTGPVVALGALAWLGAMVPAQSQQLANNIYQTDVTIQVFPTAFLEFLDNPLLYLEIPPAGSTVPSNGVRFRVWGNASATLVAEPDDFIEIPGEGWMGKAILGAGSVGYNLELRFPRLGVVGSPTGIAALPNFAPGPTTPPLTVDLMLTGGEREGVIHMETSHEYTPDGGLPLPGLYEGSVILTLTADNI